MEADKIPHEDIERYLLDQMEHNEKLSFEHRMKQNEGLSSEVAFQKSVIGGLAEARKAMLKSRLAEIPVTSSWFSHALNSTWIKVAGGVVVASAASVLSYMQVSDQSTVTNTYPKIEVTSPKYYEDSEIVLPEREEIVSTETADNSQLEKGNHVAEISSAQPSKSFTEEEPVDELAYEIPVLSLPDMGDADTIVEDLPSSREIIPDLSGDAVVRLEIIEEEGTRSYQNFDGELTLKGDFSDVIYDLLELNNSEGKQYFLEIEGKYYALPVSSEFQPIKLITDRALITSLQMLSSDK